MPPSLTHYVYCELFDPLGTWTNSIHIFFIRQRREGKNEGDPLIIKRAKCEKGQTSFRRSHHGRSYATTNPEEIFSMSFSDFNGRQPAWNRT